MNMLKNHTVISKFNSGKLQQRHPDTADWLMTVAGVCMYTGTFWVPLAVSVPVEELLCEAVLHAARRGLLLDPTLQQHLLVHLPLLLLLLQVLLHTKTLPVELLILLCRVTELRIERKIKKYIYMHGTSYIIEKFPLTFSLYCSVHL